VRRTTLCAVLIVVLGGLVVGDALGQSSAKDAVVRTVETSKRSAEEWQPPSPSAVLITRLIRLPEGLAITPAQEAAIAQIRREEGPKLVELLKRLNDTTTPQQKQAAADARKQALAAGLTGEALEQAIAAAVQLTPEQIAERERIDEEWQAFQLKVLLRLESILTAEQRAELEKREKDALEDKPRERKREREKRIQGPPRTTPSKSS